MKRNLLRDQRGQAMLEVVLLIGIVGLGLAWLVTALPAAITSHYQENQEVLASPL